MALKCQLRKRWIDGVGVAIIWKILLATFSLKENTCDYTWVWFDWFATFKTVVVLWRRWDLVFVQITGWSGVVGIGFEAQIDFSITVVGRRCHFHIRVGFRRRLARMIRPRVGTGVDRAATAEIAVVTDGQFQWERMATAQGRVLVITRRRGARFRQSRNKWSADWVIGKGVEIRWAGIARLRSGTVDVFIGFGLLKNQL